MINESTLVYYEQNIYADIFFQDIDAPGWARF